MNWKTSKILLVILLIVISLMDLNSQNLQFHYDFGKDRNYLTTTFEMYKPDKFGSTFWFIDFDFNNQANNSVSLSYFEIARYFKLGDFDFFQPTIQYNDGYADFGSLGPAYLIGIQKRLNFGTFAVNCDLLYRNDVFSDGKDGQITLSWYEVITKNLVFTGFLDIWSTGKDQKKIVILTEPQIWYNVWEQLHIGSEIEISNNFISSDILEVMPTLGFKWDF